MKNVIQFLSKRKSSHFILILSLLWIAMAPFGAAALTTTPVQAAGYQWYDGISQYSTITNCASIIQGSPYTEEGVGTYVGFLADPNSASPAPNTTYYIHVVVAGLGNSCSGMRAYLDIGLPANTSLAIDASNHVYCLYNDQQVSPASDCPQSLPSSTYNPGMFEIPSTDSAHAYTWPVPQGQFLEFQIPVRSSTALSNSTMQAKVWILDGNSSPWLQPQQGVYVFSSQPTILYPSPATTSIMSTTGHSEAYLYTHGLGGTGYFDLGTSTSYGLVHEAVTIPGSGNAFLAWDDWGPPVLLPDTLYHWRFTFTSSGGQIYGADQTFRTLPNGIVTVGSGIADSCTPAALASALATGEKVTFACGSLPATITLTSGLSITTNVTIDGGNLVTLSTNGTSNHFNVQSGGHLTLSKIKLSNGVNTADCGGSIHVLGNGSLTLTETSFDSNTTSVRGGAVCIDANGSADIHSTNFTNNQSTGGGGVFSWGTLVIDHSVFTANNSSGHGGALQNYGTGTLSDTTFDQNAAAINGGGIDAGGTLTVTRGNFTGNYAGVRGGGINDYGGTLTVAQSSFVGNQSDGYGGGIANDAGTVTIQTSEFIANTAKSVGGGLRSNGTTTVTNSTFSGNHADANGGAIENSENSSTIVLLNNTLTGNSASLQGGNIYIGSLTSDHVTLKNTLVASGSPNNCDHPVLSQGHNLESANSCGLVATGDQVNTNPMLGPLQNNGGATRTFALYASSHAVDSGTNSGCPTTDQRGVARPFDGNKDGTATCDIGAYEYNGSSAHVYLPVVRR